MVDTPLLHRGILEGRDLASPADHAVRLAALPAMARLSLRGRPGVETAAAVALGLPLPAEPSSSAVAGDVAVLHLGPDEWQVMAPDGAAVRLRHALAAALAGVPHAVVDISQRQAGLRVAGPAAADLLAHGCPLDLDVAAFPAGMATRTLLGRIEVLLWRRADQDFHVECGRSFADYLVLFLDEARRDYRALA